MKKTWKHINLEQRKLISSGIAHNDRLIEIAERLGVSPRQISKAKEVDLKANNELKDALKRLQISVPLCYNVTRKELAK